MNVVLIDRGDRQGGMHVEVKQVDKGMMIRARMTIGANMQQKGMSVLGGMPVLIDSLVDIRVDDEELLGLIPQFSSVVLKYTIRLSRTRNTSAQRDSHLFLNYFHIIWVVIQNPLPSMGCIMGIDLNNLPLSMHYVNGSGYVNTGKFNPRQESCTPPHSY